MEKIHMVSGFVIKSLPRGIVCGIAFYLGTPVLRWIFGILPAFVQEGLAVTMEYIPALGIAILATMTLTGKTAVYFILGFALLAYGSSIFTVLFVALIGLALAGIHYMNHQNKRVAVAAGSVTPDEEEVEIDE